MRKTVAVPSKSGQNDLDEWEAADREWSRRPLKVGSKPCIFMHLGKKICGSPSPQSRVKTVGEEEEVVVFELIAVPSKSGQNLLQTGKSVKVSVIAVPSKSGQNFTTPPAKVENNTIAVPSKSGQNTLYPKPYMLSQLDRRPLKVGSKQIAKNCIMSLRDNRRPLKVGSKPTHP